MRAIWMALLITVGCIKCTAATPRCETKTIGETTADVCTRSENCFDLVKEELKRPSKKWGGCWQSAIIIKYHLLMAGLPVFGTHVTVIPSYSDSDRVDIIVTVELPGHTFRRYEQKDIPVVIRDGTAQASMDISGLDEPVGVPTVEAHEKGGEKEATHGYQ